MLDKITLTSISFEWLLNNIQYGDIDYRNIFKDACYNGEIEIIKWITQNHIDDIMPPKKFDDFNFMYKHIFEDGLIYALRKSHLEIAKWLLEIYPNMNVKYVKNEYNDIINDMVYGIYIADNFICKREVEKLLLQIKPNVKYSSKCLCSLCKNTNDEDEMKTIFKF